MNDDNYSPGNGCLYDFGFSREAKLGDLLIVEVENIANTDLSYAQGMSEYNAVGRMVRDPLVALFKVRYPNQLFLTLRNNDELKQKMDKPITMTYWVAPTDAS